MKILYAFSIFLCLLITACDNDSSNTTAATDNLDLSIGTATNCSASHSNVGKSAIFSTFQHGVTGTVTIIDDCTIEITGFSYDGGGPQVYIYAGTDGDYVSSNAFQFSKLLSGISFSNNTIQLIIPDNKTLDDFNSLSVWCVDFNANFGDVIFN